MAVSVILFSQFNGTTLIHWKCKLFCHLCLRVFNSLKTPFISTIFIGQLIKDNEKLYQKMVCYRFE